MVRHLYGYRPRTGAYEPRNPLPARPQRACDKALPGHYPPLPPTRSRAASRPGTGVARTAAATAETAECSLYAPGGEPKEGQNGTVPKETLAPLARGELQGIGGQKYTCYAEQFRIRGGEVGADQVASTATVLDILQETAGNHAVTLWGRSEDGFATAEEMKGYLLVMSKLSLRMRRYPRWGDRVECMTYWKVKGKIGAVREWTLRDPATGEVLGTATSSWLFINSETRRLARIPPAMLEAFLPYSPDEFLEMPFVPENLGEIPALTDSDSASERWHSIRSTDVDMNRHVNSVVYVSWVLSSIPESEDIAGLRVAQLEVEYKQECRGDEGNILCLSQRAPAEAASKDGDRTLIFSLCNSTKGDESLSKAEFARARLVFDAL